jgi:hypothetical protein
MHDVAVSDFFEDCDFGFDAGYIFRTHAFFVDDLYGNFLAGRDVHGEMDLAEGALSDVFA